MGELFLVSLRRRWLLIATISIAAVAISLAFNLLPVLRGNEDWSWPYRPAPVARLPVLVAVVAAYLLAVRTVLITGRFAVATALTGSVIFSLTVAYVRDGDILWSLLGHVAAQSASGEHWGASVLNWSGGEWRNWTGTMSHYLGSVGTSPPGMLITYGGVAALLESVPNLADRMAAPLIPYLCTNTWYQSFSVAEWASAWLGILTPLWASLAVFPIYAVARRHSDERGARMAVLLWPLVPGVSAFIASSSTFFPAFAMFIINAFERAWAGRNLVRWLWPGLLFGLCTFVNFAFLPLGVFLGIYALILRAQQGRTFRSFLWPLVVAICAGLVPWLIFWIATGQTPLEILLQALVYQSSRNQSYFVGLWLNIWDWALWSGLLVTGITLAETAVNVVYQRDLRRTSLSTALTVSVLMLSLTGLTRGESGRIWLLFAPLAVVVAGRVFARQQGGRSYFAALCMQALLTSIMIYTIEPHAFGDAAQPPPAPQVAVSRPADAVFRSTRGEAFRMVGWDAQVLDGAVTLSMQFDSIAQPLDEYPIGVVLVAPDGTSFGSPPFQPGFDELAYPTSCWRPGQRVGIRMALDLPADAPAGEWWISVAFFGDSGGVENRFSVLNGQTPDLQVGLGPVPVP